jgi:putative methyltransferase (TIGR04325 family)
MIIWKKTNLLNITKKKINIEPFQSNIWEAKILKKLEENSKFLKKGYSKYFLANSPLPLILLNYDKKNINIADYGSGDQEVFFQILNNQYKNSFFSIDTIEVKKITQLLKKIVSKIKKPKNIKIKFLDTYNFNKKYDFVHISDALQYEINWKNFLKKIIKKKPRYVILNNLTAGKFRSYITEQKFYKSKLPYIFFNENEIIKIFKGYSLIKYFFLNKINNKFGEYPQKNFSKKDKLGYPKTFIFKLKK